MWLSVGAGTVLVPGRVRRVDYSSLRDGSRAFISWIWIELVELVGDVTSLTMGDPLDESEPMLLSQEGESCISRLSYSSLKSS